LPFFCLMLRRPPTPTLFPYTTLFRSFPLGEAKLFNQSLVGSGLFQKVQVLPLQVLDQGQFGQLLVANGPDDGRDVLPAQGFGCLQPPLPSHQLVPAFLPGGPDHDSPQDSVHFDGRPQRGQRLVVEDLPGLVWVPIDTGDGKLLDLLLLPVLRSRPLPPPEQVSQLTHGPASSTPFQHRVFRSFRTSFLLAGPGPLAGPATGDAWPASLPGGGTPRGWAGLSAPPPAAARPDLRAG